MCVDKGPAAGAGSTSASSSIIRFSYSTRDAVLTAWESAACWRDWSGHLGVDDPDGMARFVAGRQPQPLHHRLRRRRRHGRCGTSSASPTSGSTPAQLRERFPGLDIGTYYPPKRIDDPAFADDADGELTAFYNGDCGYIDDPMLAAHNLAHAARHHGAEFRFRADGRRRSVGAAGRVTGVDARAARSWTAPVVVNVGGPHSGGHQRHGGRRRRHAHRPPAAAPGGVRRAGAAPGSTLDDGGPFVADLDLGQYFRPQAGGTLLVGGTEPECDVLEWIDDPDDFVEHADRRALGDVDAAPRPAAAGVRRADEAGRSGRAVRRVGRLGADLRPLQPRRLLHGVRHERQPVQERAARRPVHPGARSTPPTPASTTTEDPVQFAGPLTGRTINLGAFSRRRDPAVTSGTVMG